MSNSHVPLRNAHEPKHESIHMDLVLLKTFLKVATMGSITKAAAVLLVTQSAVSRRIQHLEDSLGSPLLDRTGTTLKPTTAGRLLIDRGRKMLEIEQDIFTGLTACHNKQRISFCCTPTLGMYRLPDFLSSFVASHSKTIDFSCVFTMPEEALEGIETGTFDLALIEHCDEIDLQNYVAHHLPDDEMVFISSPLRGITGTEVEIGRLFEERLYLKNKQGCAKRFMDKNLSLMGRTSDDFSSVVYFDDISFLISEVKVGNGICFISKAIVKEELQKGLLAHKVLGFNHFRPRTLILPRGNKPSMLLDGFINELLEELRMEQKHEIFTP